MNPDVFDGLGRRGQEVVLDHEAAHVAGDGPGSRAPTWLVEGFADSINATIDQVSCTNCAVGTGYAAFRMANNNGRIGGGYASVNIIAKSVVARGGGRHLRPASRSPPPRC